MVARILMTGALMAFLAVAGGAFGAHILRPILSSDMFSVFETGIRYHMYHAFAMLMAGWAFCTFHLSVFRHAAWFFLIGIFLFSGSLYVLACSEIHWVGVLTPLGGICFLIGWGLLARGFSKTAK